MSSIDMNSPELRFPEVLLVDLSQSAVGIRVFKIGQFDQESEEIFRRQVETVKDLDEYLKGQLGELSPKLVVITNSDLEEYGQNILSESGLKVVRADQEKAKRRADHGQGMIKEAESRAKGDFSYADMLNSIIDDGELKQEVANYIFTSADLGNKLSELLRQLSGMRIVYDKWQEKKPNKLAMVGSLVADVHDVGLIDRVIEGTEDLSLENLNGVFPNNTCSIVSPDARFSGLTDNGLAGSIEINGKFVPMGGNEDFDYGFDQMFRNGRDCVLLIDPYLPGEREGEVKGVEEKKARRQVIYWLYAKRQVKRAFRSKSFTIGDEFQPESTRIETIVQDVIDAHLFFARLNADGQPEVVLTQRQKAKSISSPILNRRVSRQVVDVYNEL